MKNIVLIGFMGSGKSVIGKCLSNKLRIQFIDVDELIENKESKKISKIFKDKGENEFRKIEKEMITEVSKKDNVIVSTGGGAILDDDNEKNLRKKGIIVYLKASFNVLYDRIKESKNRPLLAVQSPEEEMQALLKARQLTYESVADLIIDVSKETPEKIAEKIINEVK